MWFATNAVIGDLEHRLQVDGLTVWLTGAVQVGFIVGGLVVAGTRLADRVRGGRLFLAACALAAFTNAWVLVAQDWRIVLLARFGCGVALAGVYPVGMKVVASWYREGLGRALGWLVGALVLGTASPHLLRVSAAEAPVDGVVLGTSVLALLGGLLLWALVPDGPAGRGGTSPRLRDVGGLLAHRPFRSATLGYVGHMWELYTLWALLPVLFALHVSREPDVVGLLAFLALGGGAVTCVLGGGLAERLGSARVARRALMGSIVCCALAPLVLPAHPVAAAVFLVVWGGLAVADSPQLSTLVARGAPDALRGSGLAFATALGFGTTVVSLAVASRVPPTWSAWLLLPGPLLGWWALTRTDG